MAKQTTKEECNNELLREILDYNMYCGEGAEIIPVLGRGTSISAIRYFQTFNGEAMYITKTNVIEKVNEMRKVSKLIPLKFTAQDVI
jgi:hypothetical protein